MADYSVARGRGVYLFTCTACFVCAGCRGLGPRKYGMEAYRVASASLPSGSLVGGPCPGPAGPEGARAPVGLPGPFLASLGRRCQPWASWDEAEPVSWGGKKVLQAQKSRRPRVRGVCAEPRQDARGCRSGRGLGGPPSNEPAPWFLLRKSSERQGIQDFPLGQSFCVFMVRI